MLHLSIMNDSYNIIKSLHIVFMVSWFAGLFYIVRLFIYHVEAGEKVTEVYMSFPSHFSFLPSSEIL